MPKTFYWQKLPHIHPKNAIFFVTYRLEGSMPKEKIIQLQQEYEASLFQLQKAITNSDTFSLAKENVYMDYFEKVDVELDNNFNAPYWLKQTEIAEQVAASLHHLALDKINLWAFCIMPNHVHVVFDLKNDTNDVVRILQQHKSFTAKRANKILNRTGQFWERESYDHVIRNGKFENIINYTIFNPVKANFVKNWEDWKWTYLNPLLL